MSLQIFFLNTLLLSPQVCHRRWCSVRASMTRVGEQWLVCLVGCRCYGACNWFVMFIWHYCLSTSRVLNIGLILLHMMNEIVELLHAWDLRSPQSTYIIPLRLYENSTITSFPKFNTAKVWVLKQVKIDVCENWSSLYCVVHTSSFVLFLFLFVNSLLASPYLPSSLPPSLPSPTSFSSHPIRCVVMACQDTLCHHRITTATFAATWHINEPWKRITDGV